VRDGIVFYKSFYESISELPKENALNIYNAIFRYAFFDEEPELSGIEKAIFTIVKPQIDANNKKYENGKKGGRPPKKAMDKEEKTSGFENVKPNVKENDNDKEKGNVTVKEKEYSCTEPDKSAPVPAVIELILNDKSLYPITQEDVDKWQELYPAANIMQELRKMKGWLDANPAKRKTRKGIKKFITSWLAREQDRGGAKTYGERKSEIESESSVCLWQ